MTGSHRIRGLFRRFEISRAVAFNVCSQIWSGLAGPATMLVIAHFFSREQQGYYYTFNSVLALQAFVELGLATVLINVASHEWASLEISANRGILGDERALSRLSSIMRLGVAWYAICGGVVAVGLSVGGCWFFSSNSGAGVNWQAPWISLCALAGLLLLLTPFSAVLEGCNQVSATYGLRFANGIVGSLAIILGISLGAGLYALALSALARLLCGVLYLGWRYWRFYRALFVHRISEHVDWRAEILPFQWRIAVTWISGYFVFALFNPVIFHYHGAAAAGQMGMTITLTGVVPSMAYSWVQTRVPQFGSLIARRDYMALDTLFRRLAIISIGITVIGSAAIWGLVAWIGWSGLSIAHRILTLLPTTLLMLVGILNTFVFVLAMYLRSHKREPLMVVSVASGILTGVGVWLFGAKYGPIGAVTSYLAVTAFWTTPATGWVFRQCRAVWHSASFAASVYEPVIDIEETV